MSYHIKQGRLSDDVLFAKFIYTGSAIKRMSSCFAKNVCPAIILFYVALNALYIQPIVVLDHINRALFSFHTQDQIRLFLFSDNYRLLRLEQNTQIRS